MRTSLGMAGANPAGRLHAILSTARGTKKERPTHEAWSAAIGVPLSDTARFFEGMAAVLTLPGEVVSALRRAGMSGQELELFTTWKAPVDAVLSALNLHQAWNDAKAQLTDVAMHSLQHCDNYLSNHWQEPQLSADDLADIQVRVDTLFEEVASADIDADLKRFSLDHLGKIAAAVRKFRIDGTRPIQQAVQSAVGELAVRKDLLGRMWESITGKKVVSALNGFLLLLRIADTSADLYARLQLPAAPEAAELFDADAPKLIDPPGTTEPPPIRDGEVVDERIT
jgi:hypothetical protein